MNGLGSGSARWAVSAARPGLLAAPSVRLAQALCLVLVLWWVFGPLGGVSVRPKTLEGGGNDTSPVFNWHPLLMVVAFPLLMGEAVLAYRAPAANLDTRPAKKAYHVTLQLLAWTLAVLGLTAAVRSHTLKLPQPIPNFYSPHSFLGILVFVLLFFQICVGLYSYVWPGLVQARRQALSPYHIFLGRAIFVLGLATAAVGVQEKATFSQLAGGVNVRSAGMRLPASLELALAAAGVAVLWQHAGRGGSVVGAGPQGSLVQLDGIPLFEHTTARQSGSS